MDVFKSNIQYGGCLDKLKLIIVVRGDLRNKELVGYTWCLSADAVKHKARVHQLDFIGEFLQSIFKNRAFVKLDSRYADYFP